MHKKTFLHLFLPLMLVLAACSAAAPSALAPMEEPGSAEGGGFDGDASFQPAPDIARDTAEQGVSTSGETGIERLVIKNGELSIAVDNPETDLAEVMSMAEEMGGFVVSSRLYYRTLASGAEVPQADVTIRVPAERFDEALIRIKDGAGQVLSESVTGQDVTQQYVDLQSRLTNLEAAEAELQRIMEEATDTEDVLNVYNQLIYIREQIEVIKGQITYFEQSAAFSAIYVSIVADEAVQPLTIGGWEPAGVAKDAIQALINTLQSIAEVLLWIVLWLLPVLLVIYIPLRLAWAGIKRLRNRGKAKPAQES
ncbi:MAG TPA: DUF4349 domain-containing protein [Anaerolineales bacterium]|nr:DUF4349 domain-containing protein [Anaerolineales bacterium]